MVCSARRMRRRAAAAARQAPSAAACRRAAARASARRSSAPCTRRAAASAAHPASMPAACAHVAVAARRAASAARSLAFGRCVLGFGSLAGTVQSRMQPTRCAASAAAHQACQGPTHSMTLFMGPGAHDQQRRASPASRLVATAQIARQHISDRRTLSLTAQGGATAAHLLASDRARQAANAAASRRAAVRSTAARRRPCAPTRTVICAFYVKQGMHWCLPQGFFGTAAGDAHADGVAYCQACELGRRMALHARHGAWCGRRLQVAAARSCGRPAAQRRAAAARIAARLLPHHRRGEPPLRGRRSADGSALVLSEPSNWCQLCQVGLLLHAGLFDGGGGVQGCMVLQSA